MKTLLNLAPTAKMIETLMECHEREILQLEPCTSYNVSSTRGLYERGYFDCLNFIDKKGKKQVGFRVTTLGKRLLEKYIGSKEKSF